MLYRDTINGINRLEYKLLFEIACEQKGYTFSISDPDKFSIKHNLGDEAAACRWAYQTLRWMPISALFYDTGTPEDTSMEAVATAIREFFNLDVGEMRDIIIKRNIKLNAGEDTKMFKHLRIIREDLLDDIEYAVNTMIPQLGNGENILSLYTYTAQLRNGVRQRYRALNRELIRENPWLLDNLELDFHEWFRHVNIDPERQDAYVAENVIGFYIGNFFFKEWNQNHKQDYLGSSQRVVVSGEYLDVQNTEVVSLPDRKDIDFSQTMQDIVLLSRDLFTHATALRRGDYIALQYSVLEWYANKDLTSIISTLNHVYHAILRGNVSNLAREAVKSTNVTQYLVLNTEFQVKRRPKNTVDNALLTRIRVNQGFLNTMHKLYRQVSIDNVTAAINGQIMARAATSKDGKSDSNYPYFREGVDVVIPNFERGNSLEVAILNAKFPHLHIMEKLASGEMTQEELMGELARNKAAGIITDAGYKKFSLVVRCMRELDDLNQYLLENGMSIADLNSVSVLTPEYFQIIQDLEGVLYDKLSSPWNSSHDGNDTMSDGIDAEIICYISNSEVRELLESAPHDPGDYAVDLNALKNSTITKKLGGRDYRQVPQLPCFRPIYPDNLLGEMGQCWTLVDLHKRSYPDAYIGAGYSTRADVYREGLPQDAGSVIYEHMLYALSPWTTNKFVELTGCFAMAILLLYKLEYQEKDEQAKSIHSQLTATMNSMGNDYFSGLSRTAALMEESMQTGGQNFASLMSGISYYGAMVLNAKQDKQGNYVLPDWTIYVGPMEMRPTGVFSQRHGRELLNSEALAEYQDWFATGKLGQLLSIEARGERAQLGLITSYIMYFNLLHSISDIFLTRHSAPWENVPCTCAAGRYWAVKDALNAKLLSYQLRVSIQHEYVNPINALITIYNESQSARTKASYKTYTSLAIIDMRVQLKELRAKLIQVSELYQKLRSGVSEDVFLVEMDSLGIQYPTNILASYKTDSQYTGAINTILLHDTVSECSRLRLLQEVDKMLDAIQEMHERLKRELSLKTDIARGLRVDTMMLLTQDRLHSIIRDPKNPLNEKYLLMCIRVGKDPQTQEKMRRFFGSSVETLTSDSFGFLKNSEGRYFCAQPTPDTAIFVHKTGVAFMCELEIEAGEQGVTLIGLPELSGGLVWE